MLLHNDSLLLSASDGCQKAEEVIVSMITFSLANLLRHVEGGDHG
jgi:hypothetical protein